MVRVEVTKAHIHTKSFCPCWHFSKRNRTIWDILNDEVVSTSPKRSLTRLRRKEGRENFTRVKIATRFSSNFEYPEILAVVGGLKAFKWRPKFCSFSNAGHFPKFGAVGNGATLSSQMSSANPGCHSLSDCSNDILGRILCQMQISVHRIRGHVNWHSRTLSTLGQ